MFPNICAGLIKLDVLVIGNLTSCPDIHLHELFFYLSMILCLFLTHFGNNTCQFSYFTNLHKCKFYLFNGLKESVNLKTLLSVKGSVSLIIRH